MSYNSKIRLIFKYNIYNTYFIIYGYMFTLYINIYFIALYVNISFILFLIYTFQKL